MIGLQVILLSKYPFQLDPILFHLYCTVLKVMNDHSGYHFPFSFSPEFHDFHHLRFHTSYGWLGVSSPQYRTLLHWFVR